MQQITLKRYILITVLLLQASLLLAAVPSGYYYFVKNKKQAELKTALHTYCAPIKEFDYGSGPGFTWEGFFSTDRRADSTVIDMYSNIVRKFSGYSAVSGMHIEHSFPKSWWGAYPNNAYKDLFHLYPADGVTNSTKNNLPLGEVTGTPSLDNGVSKVGKNGFKTAYTSGCFEPADEYKGDFARSYFYISTIYENLAPLMQSPMTYTNNTYPFWKPWALDLLLKWHRQDPVSDKERTRIEAVYAIQGNRNPFIDYPDLVEYIWGKDTLNVFPFPNETEPFLLAPRRGTSVDFGVILQNDTRKQNLHIQGVNIASQVQLSLLHSDPAFSLSVSTISTVDMLNGLDLALTFTPVTSGLVRDTLVIKGGGLTEALQIPIKALASADFITLEPTDITPVGGTLQWISDPLATNYILNLYQGDKQAGDLIISAYVEGSSWNKAIELYNGTGKTIDLSHYSLRKQSDGAGSFGSTIQLAGTLDNNKTYVIANNNKLVNSGLRDKAQLLDSLINFNGNDAVALVRSGVTIDMVGKANAGADVSWGQDISLQRKASVTHPISTFDPLEWETYPIDTYSILGNHSMNLASANDFVLQNVLTGNVTSYSIQNLFPEKLYTFSVQSMRSGVIAPAINTMQLHTSSLDVPEISDPDNIQSKQFTANWGASPYASGYFVNVFKLIGSAETTEVEGFATVGTNGTPLPTGWTGTASGSYTGTGSTGIASPSIGLKTSGEKLQTKNYPAPVNQFTFMYKFASSSPGSSVIVSANSNGNWIRIDSIIYVNATRAYPTYTFNKTQNISSFLIKYNKVGGGNLSIDDVSATYGGQDTVYIRKDSLVSTNQAVVSGLTESSLYFYAVRATLGSSVSGVSETISARTLLDTKVSEQNAPKIKILSDQEQVTITGLNGHEFIQIYSLTGICMFQAKVNSTQLNIPLKQKGIFILKVQGENYTYTGKFIR